jgi:hypothetical protein
LKIMFKNTWTLQLFPIDTLLKVPNLVKLGLTGEEKPKLI